VRPLGGALTNGDSRRVRLTIPARAEYIALGRLALTGLARLQTFPEEALEDLKLALTEACTNSVRHAYRHGDPGNVEIVYELFSDRLVVEVSDEGGGFDPEAPMGGAAPALEEGGLGIAIIRAIADEVEIGSQAGGTGSRLRFIKSLT
jgi:serine/threonine-protein kinase RsbW